MIEVSNTAAVALAVGQALPFNNVIWKSGCAESFRGGSSQVRIGAGVYELTFHGNVSGPTAATAVQLNIAIDGAALPETTMISTPTVAGDLNNVSAGTKVGNQSTCCNPCPGNLSVSVVNTGTTPITIAANSVLSVKRIG